MVNESEKDVLDEEIRPSDDTTDWEARAKELENKIGRARDSRKSMKDKYESRITDLEAQLKSPTTQEPKPDEKLLKKLNTALMRSYGYMDIDEVAIVEKWQTDTGKDIEELFVNPTLSKIIKAEIDDIRTTKTNEAATKNIQSGRGGGTDIKTDPQYWIGRGENPPNTPEYRDVRQKIINHMSEQETGMKSLQVGNGYRLGLAI